MAAGTTIEFQAQQFTLDYTVLEGHRFAVKPIAQDEALLSWGCPFGIAAQPIAPLASMCATQARLKRSAVAR
ncbi:MAG: hypothetical protein R3E79_29370 [Caldilineaceae bacterium]